jgi:hypothetical protein
MTRYSDPYLTIEDIDVPIVAVCRTVPVKSLRKPKSCAHCGRTIPAGSPAIKSITIFRADGLRVDYWHPAADPPCYA